MITTSTGAKKLESSDNWREIFPNPGTGAAGAHNASVDAQDRIQAEVAPIINGKRCSLGAASGDYVLLRNSTIAGKTDGAYKATKAIPADTDLDSTYLGSPITGGMVNELNNNITNVDNKWNIQYGALSSGVNWFKMGNLVEISFNVSAAEGISVTGGSYAYVDYIPVGLGPLNGHGVVGVATNADGTVIGIVGIQTSDRRIFIQSPTTANFVRFSIVYCI